MNNACTQEKHHHQPSLTVVDPLLIVQICFHAPPLRRKTDLHLRWLLHDQCSIRQGLITTKEKRITFPWNPIKLSSSNIGGLQFFDQNKFASSRKSMAAPAEREDNTSGVLGATWRKGRGLFIPLPPLYYLYTSAAHPLGGIEKNIANFATQIISPVKEITVGQSTRPAIGPVCDKGARRGKRETNTYLMEVQVWLSSGEN